MRKAHCLDITKFIARVNALLAEEVTDIHRLRSFEAQLKEKVETFKKCDEEGSSQFRSGQRDLYCKCLK